MSNELPDKPSDLLELALSDLEKVEGSSRYKVYMYTWHVPQKRSVCQVCMAGAVMAKTLKADRFKRHSPEDFENDTKKKLTALNYFRTGLLDLALEVLGIDHPLSLVKSTWVASYQTDREQFKKDMRDIIEALKGEGL